MSDALAMFVDVGWLGSVTDVATFIAVAVALARRELRDRRVEAALVALAKADPHVDAHQVARDLALSVDDDAVRAVLADGGREDDDGR
ncbi:hypothetical protein [Haloferax marisrubri]|uniref:Uncharacterized protein n=1 Tax=Haloferax marisrubri TaxID=1544719 RepID=A0A2P4NU74_9EURY|nr:hypothetical protein [Haloferax marisrubri]POG56687.1 hypothetical protein AUR65_002340 [Haloferax marisrubri]